MINLDSAGTLEVNIAQEREYNGIVGGTVDPDKSIDTAGTLELTDSVYTMFDSFGIYFVTWDNVVSFYSNGFVEAPEIIEGSRNYISNAAKLNVVFLKEII